MERSRPLHSMCQDAAVVGAADDEPDPACRAQRQEAVERPLFEQRVASREQHPVEIAGGKRLLAHLPFVDAAPARTDPPAVTQLPTRPITAPQQPRKPPRVALPKPDTARTVTHEA